MDIECAVCGVLRNGSEFCQGPWLPADHVKALGHLLDYQGDSTLLQLASQNAKEARHRVNSLEAGVVRHALDAWCVGSKPLCCCFPCACCQRVLFYGDAHRHMLAALQHPSIKALLSLQEAELVQQLQQQPMPADSLGVVDDDVEVGGWTPMQCLEAMYRILMCLLPKQREVQEGATPKRYACGHAEMSAEEASHQSACLSNLEMVLRTALAAGPAAGAAGGAAAVGTAGLAVPAAAAAAPAAPNAAEGVPDGESCAPPAASSTFARPSAPTSTDSIAGGAAAAATSGSGHCNRLLGHVHDPDEVTSWGAPPPPQEAMQEPPQEPTQQQPSGGTKRRRGQPISGCRVPQQPRQRDGREGDDDDDDDSAKIDDNFGGRNVRHPAATGAAGGTGGGGSGTSGTSGGAQPGGAGSGRSGGGSKQHMMKEGAHGASAAASVAIPAGSSSCLASDPRGPIADAAQDAVGEDAGEAGRHSGGRGSRVQGLATPFAHDDVDAPEEDAGLAASTDGAAPAPPGRVPLSGWAGGGLGGVPQPQQVPSPRGSTASLATWGSTSITSRNASALGRAPSGLGHLAPMPTAAGISRGSTSTGAELGGDGDDGQPPEEQPGGEACEAPTGAVRRLGMRASMEMSPATPSLPTVQEEPAGVDRNTPPQAPAAVFVRPGAPVPTPPTTPESMAPTSRLKTVVASVARTMTSVWRSLCSVVKGRGGAQAHGRELLVAGSGPEGGRT